MAIITSIDKNGIGKQLRLKVGDELLSFDGKPFCDMLDYYYYDGQDQFIMTIKRGKKTRDYDIEKYPHETLGLEFDGSVELTPLRCKNKCKFCFVDQLPCGMRESLYVKDDDYRLSFISGNYITLTNVGDCELQRIVDMRLSPLYISVHATDCEVKDNLVSNPEGLKTYTKMLFLKEHGIKMQAQIVMCQSINDGEVLSRTLNDLAQLAPELQTIAVVPSGLTKHRQGLFPLQAVTRDSARDAIDRIAEVNNTQGYPMAYASDEMYLRGEVALPSYGYYGTFNQIENGVGLMRTFERELDERLAECSLNLTKIDINCVTGVSFGDFLTEQMAKVKSKYPNVNIIVHVVVNKFFGESITVAGLLTGGDIIEALSGRVGSNLIIPSNMLREFTDCFLDNVTTQDLERALDTRLHLSRGGSSIVDIIDSIISEV